MKTRSDTDRDKKFYHYFYAANLIQLLVKPNINFLEKLTLRAGEIRPNLKDNKNTILRSRYHLDYPLTVKNPLTNQVIVGEVQFYLISQTFLKEYLSENYEQQNLKLKANFIGTDYTYAYC